MADSAVWKFGYGSNISPEFLRTKKQLKVLDCKRCVLHGFALSFPLGRGLDFVEPAMATLRSDAEGFVHGTACLFPLEDAAKLDEQEGGYDIKTCPVCLYDEDGQEGAETLDVQVYTARRPEPEGHPQGPCSKRYRDILVNSAMEVGLEDSWVAKLQALPTYTPSEETLAARSALPLPESLPQMSVAQLRLHDGSNEEAYPVRVAICGYIFDHRSFLKVHWGRDITYRMSLHARGINMDSNDDAGVSPFPKLEELEPVAKEYVLQYRDRFNAKGGVPIAALTEFWRDQSAL